MKACFHCLQLAIFNGGHHLTGGSQHWPLDASVAIDDGWRLLPPLTGVNSHFVKKNEYPHGVLYYEIKLPEAFVDGLSRELGMKTSPCTVLDLALGYISQKYTHYYVLPDAGPDDRLRGVGKILDVVGEAALRYKKEHKRVPVLFIDGVDLLAKADRKVCDRLITLAKVMANSNEMKIILRSQ